jgi:hypothetical protein
MSPLWAIMLTTFDEAAEGVRRLTLLTLCGLTILAWAGAAATGQPPAERPPPAPALAKLTCKTFRASQQVEIHGTLAATQHGTYTAVTQLTTPHGQPVFPEPIPLGTLIWPQPQPVGFLLTSPQHTASPGGGTWTVTVTLSQGHTPLGSHSATVRCPRF